MPVTKQGSPLLQLGKVVEILRGVVIRVVTCTAQMPDAESNGGAGEGGIIPPGGSSIIPSSSCHIGLGSGVGLGGASGGA